jgi:hypothetical protein
MMSSHIYINDMTTKAALHYIYMRFHIYEYNHATLLFVSITYLLSAVPATSCSQNALIYLAATSSFILIITSAIADAAIGFKFDCESPNL